MILSGNCLVNCTIDLLTRVPADRNDNRSPKTTGSDHASSSINRGRPLLHKGLKNLCLNILLLCQNISRKALLYSKTFINTKTTISEDVGPYLGEPLYILVFLNFLLTFNLIIHVCIHFLLWTCTFFIIALWILLRCPRAHIIDFHIH